MLFNLDPVLEFENPNERCSEFISGGLPRWKKLSHGKSSRDLLTMILAEFSGEHGIAKRPEFFQGKASFKLLLSSD